MRDWWKEVGNGGPLVPPPPPTVMRGVHMTMTTTAGGKKGGDNDEVMVDAVVKREPMDVGNGRSGPPGVELPVPGRPLQPTGKSSPKMVERLLGFITEAGGGRS